VVVRTRAGEEEPTGGGGGGGGIDSTRHKAPPAGVEAGGVQRASCPCRQRRRAPRRSSHRRQSYGGMLLQIVWPYKGSFATIMDASEDEFGSSIRFRKK
jgi:hypothetical protein